MPGNEEFGERDIINGEIGFFKVLIYIGVLLSCLFRMFITLPLPSILACVDPKASQR